MRWLTVFAVALMIVAAGDFGQSARSGSLEACLAALPGDARRQLTRHDRPRSAERERKRLSSAPQVSTTGAAAARERARVRRRRGAPAARSHTARSAAPPSAGAAGRIRALGLDD